MKKIFAAAMMFAMGSIGVGCASASDPTETSEATTAEETPVVEGVACFRLPCPCRSYDLAAKRQGIKASFRVRFAGGGFEVCGPSDPPPPPPPPPSQPVAAAPVAAAR